MPLDAILLPIFLPLLIKNLASIGVPTVFFWVLSLPLIVSYLLVRIPFGESKERGWRLGAAWSILIFLVVAILGITLGWAISLRFHNPVGTWNYVHDDPIQVEEAVRMLFDGKNPYQENYVGTPLEKWNEGNIGYDEHGVLVPNPAIYHTVKLPFHLLFSVPFLALFQHAFGWYDERLLYAALLAIALVLMVRLASTHEKKLAVVILAVFNPFFATSFLMGLNDVFVFFWIVLGCFLLIKNQTRLSSLALAAAAGSKHFAWFIAPFYFMYLFLKTPRELPPLRRVAAVTRDTWPFFVATAFIFIPFLLWNAHAFLDDTFGYLSGGSNASYPIRGWGLGGALVALNIIPSNDTSFPFWAFQLPVGLILLSILIYMQRRINSLAFVLAAGAILLAGTLIVSRFLNENYIGFLSLLLIASYVLGEDRAKGLDSK